MNHQRRPVSPNVRFRVFERDSFTCQYCGEKAPDVALEVDHLMPVSKGGRNGMHNLTTACRECNIGKYDRITDPRATNGTPRHLVAIERISYFGDEEVVYKPLEELTESELCMAIGVNQHRQLLHKQEIALLNAMLRYRMAQSDELA